LKKEGREKEGVEKGKKQTTTTNESVNESISE
jgi:hypothetical protein